MADSAPPSKGQSRKENTLALSEPVVGKLTPKSPTRETLVWDASMKSFGVRITPQGSRAYVMFYRTKAGVQRRVVIGHCDRMPLKEARLKARRWYLRVQDGGDPWAEERDEKRKARDQRRAMTMRDFAEIYEKTHLAGLKASTRAGAKGRLVNHILPALGDKPIRQIERRDIEVLKAGMSATPRGANLVLAQLRHMFSLAEGMGYFPHGRNPVIGVTRNRQHKRARFLSGAELARLGKVLGDMETTRTVSQAAVDALRLLILTGCRKTEITRLRWEHVDLEGGRIHLPDSKTGPRTIELNAAALAYLRTVRERADDGAGWVCPGRHEGKPLANLKKAWAQALRLAEIEGVRVHDLRHAFATVGVSKGIGLPLIAGLLGHSQTRVTEQYAHLASDPLKVAGNTIGAELAAALGFEVDGIAKSAREGASEAPESKKGGGGA